jgi:hypothetical protein
MAEVLGAPASLAGDDFHELWALRHALRLLNPQTDLISVVMEGVPNDERTAQLGEGAQAVDVTQVRRGPDGDELLFEQLKYSTASPASPWTWARLTRERTKTARGTSVLGKLALALERTEGDCRFRLVTNQPVAAEVARDVGELPVALRSGSATGATVDLLRRATRLSDAALARFLDAFDLSGFGAATRLQLDAEILRAISRATDADARDELDVLQQRVSALVLPENRARSEITRELLLTWLGAGSPVQLFPAPTRLTRASPYIRRTATDEVAEAIREATDRIIRVHSGGGCGKTSLVSELAPELPEGSELFVYDCYGGGLFLAADERRHLPESAFTQIANEISGRLGSPFVMRRAGSLNMAATFVRRLEAAAALLAAKHPEGLIVVVFDAVDNARIAANRWREPCFLDELVALSSWPQSVRLLVTSRTGRLPSLGVSERYQDLEIKGFDDAETRDFIGARRPGWSAEAIVELQDLSGGNPRRLSYALDKAEDEAEAIDRLMPRSPGLDPLFEKLVKAAGDRVGDDQAVWRMLCALAHMPRPTAGWALSAVTGLAELDLEDLATDVGGVIRRAEGWSFFDEDFEAFADERTGSIAPDVVQVAARILWEQRGEQPYAARAIAEVLIQAGRTQDLYDLVVSGGPPACVMDPAERRAIEVQRVVLALRAARHAKSAPDANRILVAAAAAMRTDRLLKRLLVENLDLSARLSTEEVSRLVLADRQSRARRGRLRLNLAIEAADTNPALARDHMRWWRAAVDDLRTAPPAKGGSGISVDDVALELEVNWKLQGFPAALGSFSRWGPRKAMIGAVQRLASRAAARGDVDRLGEAWAYRRWPAKVSTVLMEALLLAGGALTDEMSERALQDLMSLRRRDPIKQPGQALRVLALLEALARTDISAGPLLAALDRHFPPEAFRSADPLHPILSGADIIARAWALREGLGGEVTDLDTRLPPARAVPEPQQLRRGQKRDQAGDDRRRRIEAWNEERRGLAATLTTMLAAARLRASSETPPEEVTAAIASLIASLVRLASDNRRGHSLPAAERLGHTWALELSRRGELTAAVLERLRPRSDPRAILDQIEWITRGPGAAAAVVEPLAAVAQALELAPGSATDRATALLRCTRIALPLDRHLASNLYGRALALTERIDSEAVTQLKAACAVAAAGIAGSREDRRDRAERLAEVIGAVAATVGDEGEGYMPFADVLKACAALDPPTALAVLGRWRDLGVLALEQGLEALREEGALQMLPPPLRSLVLALGGAEAGPLLDTSEDAGQVAREALLSGDVSDAVSAWSTLERAGLEGSPNHWVHRLREALPSLHDMSALEGSVEEAEDAPPIPPPALGALGEIELAWATEPGSRKGPSLHRLQDVTERVRDPTLRRPMLERLVELFPASAEVAELLVEILPAWRAYPPVEAWARDALPGFIVGALPRLFQWRYDDTELLDALLDATGLASESRFELILRAIETHGEALSPDLLFALAGVVGVHGDPAARAPLFDALLDNLTLAVDQPAQAPIQGAGAPASPDEAAARLLFALFGDIDKRVRWRAAHAALQLSQSPALVSGLVSLLTAETETVFAAPKPPFYLLAARQHLAIVLHRIALQWPARLAGHGPALYEACLSGGPHVIIREFLKRALLTTEASAPSLPPEALEQVRRANLSPFPKRRIPRAQVRYGRRDLRDANTDERESLRYHFDDTDTIPYWYSPAANIFGVSQIEFARRAEGWILDAWRLSPEGWKWAEEPRSERFDRWTDGLTSHRHGSEPTVERLSRYGEWHAMHCVVGELIMEQPEVEREYGDDIEGWIAEHFLTRPEAWLADLRTPPPPDARFWDTGAELEPPGEDWLGPISQESFAHALTVALSEDRLVVSASYEMRLGAYREHTRISSALVSPSKAQAFGRALQTARDPMDFLLPPADDHREIKAPGFILEGWLAESHRDARLDATDPFRGAVADLPFVPSARIEAGLGLTLDPWAPGWARHDVPSPDLSYEMWGEDDSPPSRGWRGSASRTLLSALLRTTKRSLLLDVELTRSEGSEHDNPRRTRWQVFVLTADGQLLTVDRRRRGLGCYLVRRLGLEPSVDTLGRAMAHHLGAVMERARMAPPQQREKAEARVAKAVTALTDHLRDHRDW